MRPQGSFGGRLGSDEVVTHCLLVERAEGLVLVDTGFGLATVDDPKRLGRVFTMAMRPALDVAEAALTQVTRLGFTKDDVTDVVLTHMDVDHAGGIGDFPGARIHVDASEFQVATKPHGAVGKWRYVAAHWAHHPKWELHGSGGDDWFGFEGVKVLGDDVLLVPLRGHSHGHVGVAVRRPEGGWLLDAGDSYFSAGETRTPPAYLPGMVAFQKLMGVDEDTRRDNQARLRELKAAHGDEVEVFCSHSAEEFARLATPVG